MRSHDIENVLTLPDVEIGEAMRKMSDGGAKSLIVTDSDRRFLGVLTDGNLRRHILAQGGLSGTIDDCYNRQPSYLRVGSAELEAKTLMLAKKIEMIPVIDEEHVVVGVYIWSDVFTEDREEDIPADCEVVIMAGGRGSRLDPFTRVLPKPLIPIGDTPVIELIMMRLAKHGLKKFHVTINHKAHIMRAYFMEKKHDFELHWIEEDEPLGTAGSLAYLAGQLDKPLLVTNCDTLINYPLNEILNHHVSSNSDITMVAATQHFVVPYGVCEMSEGGLLSRINEKPSMDYLVNTGMYLVQPKLLSLIPRDQNLNFTDFIEIVRNEGGRVSVFPVNRDAWIDVGQWGEFRKAVDALS